MTDREGPLLVLGIGNVLLRDEGVGVAAIRELEDRVSHGELRLPSDTRLLDGGTLGLDLLPIISDARALVMVDAVDLGGEPGTVRVIRGEALHGALAGHVSPHQVGVGDLLASARLLGSLPEDVTLVGIQPRDIAIGLDLSPPVAAALPSAVEAAIVEIERASAADRASALPEPVGVGAISTAGKG